MLLFCIKTLMHRRKSPLCHNYIRGIQKNLQQYKKILGKQPSSLTQVDIFDPLAPTDNQRTTLISKVEIEHSIIQGNRRHSLQSLSTPFMSNCQLTSAINLMEPHKLDQLLD
jgi:hypothetical protein